MAMIKIKKINAPTCKKCDNKQPLKDGNYVSMNLGKGNERDTYMHYCGKCKEEYWLDRTYPAYVNKENPTEFWKIDD